MHTGANGSASGDKRPQRASEGSPGRRRVARGTHRCPRWDTRPPPVRGSRKRAEVSSSPVIRANERRKLSASLRPTRRDSNTQPLAGTVGNVIAVRSRRWHPPGSVIVGLASVLAAVVAISGCGQRDQNNPQSGVAERREQPPPSERNQDLLSDKASRATPTKPPNESKPTTGEWTPSAEKDGVGRGSGDSQEPRASRKSAGGRADGGGRTSSLLGSTPSVDSPEGRRLLRESPDCRDAPPPPPGYSGPVQC
jgi:hypothetical protein